MVVLCLFKIVVILLLLLVTARPLQTLVTEFLGVLSEVELLIGQVLILFVNFGAVLEVFLIALAAIN